MNTTNTYTNIFTHASMNLLTHSFSLLLMALVLHGAASAQTLNFSVDMQHAWLEPGDNVVVRGSIPELGSWTDNGELRLRKERGNSSVFKGELTLNSKPTQPILYKFVILRSGGQEEWEQRGNRVVSPASTETLWFDDRETGGIQQTVVQVTFRLDLSEHTMNGEPATEVALMGARAPLSFDLEAGRTAMAEVSEGIWEASVTFPYGTPHDIPFKFAWTLDGEWVWEWRSGHTNHVFLIDDSGSDQLVSLRYDIDKPGIVPVAGATGSIDDYEAVVTFLGTRGQGSRYQYERAMELMEAGNVEAAQAQYNRYKVTHPGVEEIDDFHYEMAGHISETQGLGAANTYIDTQLQTETDPVRRSYYGYLRGELAMNAGQKAKARKQFKKLVKANGEDMAGRYARKALAFSYLGDEADSAGKAIPHFRKLIANAPSSERRQLSRNLAWAYNRMGNVDKRDSVMTVLATTGTPSQRGRAALELARTYQKQGKHTEALGLLDAAEFTAAIPRGLNAEAVQLRIQAYHHLEMHQELITLYDQFEQQWPGNAHLKRLGKFAEDSRRKAPTRVLTQPELQTATPDSTQHQEDQP